MTATASTAAGDAGTATSVAAAGVVCREAHGEKLLYAVHGLVSLPCRRRQPLLDLARQVCPSRGQATAVAACRCVAGQVACNSSASSSAAAARHGGSARPGGQPTRRRQRRGGGRQSCQGTAATTATCNGRQGQLFATAAATPSLRVRSQHRRLLPVFRRERLLVVLSVLVCPKHRRCVFHQALVVDRHHAVAAAAVAAAVLATLVSRTCRCHRRWRSRSSRCCWIVNKGSIP